MKPKEILLFGASGQIGRHLIRKLTKNNYKVTAVTRNYHQKAFILKTQANPGTTMFFSMHPWKNKNQEALHPFGRTNSFKFGPKCKVTFFS